MWGRLNLTPEVTSSVDSVCLDVKL